MTIIDKSTRKILDAAIALAMSRCSSEHYLQVAQTECA
jgi:hypothetical protein